MGPWSVLSNSQVLPGGVARKLSSAEPENYSCTPSPTAFKGLAVAALLSLPFWGILIYFLLRYQ